MVAPREWDAIKAARALKVDWQTNATLPGNGKLHATMRAAGSTAGQRVDALASLGHMLVALYLVVLFEARVPFTAGVELHDAFLRGDDAEPDLHAIRAELERRAAAP